MHNLDTAKYVLNLSCPDTTGISAGVCSFINNNGGFINATHSYGDPSTNMFFMRTVFSDVDNKMGSREDLKGKFKQLGDKYSMQWNIYDANYKPKVLIAVSKFGHCLNDLLHKTKSGQIPMEIVGVVSNHTNMKEIADWYGISFFHLPVTKETKQQQEQEILNLYKDLSANLIVLARYMQILSPELCNSLKERCINIHHSFLPSFKGAMPYSQAHERGVKIVGATAHYVTPNLDEGPIIEQAVERVNHTFTVDDIAGTVKDLETLTLSRAVKYHVERRILLNAHKTVVFK